MDLFDIFEQPATYPDYPGFKARDTAQAAAHAVAPKAPRLRELCLETLRAAGALTADECAARLGVDRLSVRPRFSELATTAKIIDTGQRRLNASNKRAIVWCAAVSRKSP
jgi:hypothetical protein